VSTPEPLSAIHSADPEVTGRFGGVRLLLVAVALVLACAAVPVFAKTCPWPEPGADPYRGDAAEAVERLPIPASERSTLAAMVRLDYGWSRIAVGRDDIDGGRYADLRAMNFGSGRICDGLVDRSMWTAGRQEVAKVYTVGRYSVLHFASCNNVALATYTLALDEPLRGRELFDARKQQQQIAPGLGGPFAAPVAVPEPSSIALGLLAVLAALSVRKGRK